MAKGLDPNFKKTEFESDTRNVSDLWSRAILSYNETAAVPLVVGKFQDTQAMIDFGTQEMNQFHKWRHDDKKVDKLRTLFIGNIGFIEEGMKQIISAASTSFPPAAAIGTALTFVLSAAKSVSADYDVIINFFEDMNNFLQRVSIIATRVPRKQAYQNALLDVFASFLFMIGVTHTTIKQGRFKKWAINSVFGGDSNLSGGRKNMDLTLTRLESATQFAILDNSENMIDKQEDLEATLATYQQELLQNQRIQQRLASSQSLALQNIQDTLLDFKDDIKKLLEFSRQERKSIESKPKQEAEAQENATNRVRSAFGIVPDVNSLFREAEAQENATNRVRLAFGIVPDVNSLIRELEKTQVEKMCAWLFENPVWKEWVDQKSNSPSLLTIEGPPGIGKSFTSLAVFRHLQKLSETVPESPSCVAYFTFGEGQQTLNTTEQALISAAVQLTDRYTPVREVLEAKIEDEAQLIRLDTEDELDYWDFFIGEVFNASSKIQLYLVLDGLDELFSDEERQMFLKVMARFKEQNAKVKVVVTDRARTTSEIPDHSSIIHMSKDTILPDLRTLIWDRLHNTDSAYEGLRKLSKSTKQRLARKVEQNADGLLYAEQMLRYLSGIARESVINKILADDLPKSLVGLYEMVLDRAKRSLDDVTLPIMRTIVVWASFALQRLSLADLNALGKLLFPNKADIVEEKLLEEFTPFFEMSYVSTDVAEVDRSVDPKILFSDEEIVTVAADQIDSKIYVKLRERTMKNFFGAETDSEHEFTMTRSRANALIFQTSTQMVFASDPDATLEPATKPILDYAVCNAFRHWTEINPSEFTDEEKVELCSTFVKLITGRKFATDILQLPLELNIPALLGTDGAGMGSGKAFYEKWKVWSEVANTLPLTAEVSAYWSGDVEDAIWPLAESYMVDWLNGSIGPKVWKAYRFAFDAVNNTKKKGLLDRFFDQELAAGSSDAHLKAVEDLRNLAQSHNIELNQPGLVHYPYAVCAGNKGQYNFANSIYKDYLQYCSDPHQKVRCLSNLGYGYQLRGEHETALCWFDEAMRVITNWLGISIEDVEAKGGVVGDIVDATETGDGQANQKESKEQKDDMLMLLGSCLINKGKSKHRMKQFSEAVALLRQSRRWRPDIVPARILLKELEFLWDTGPVYGEIMDTLMEFKPIERLNLMTSSSLDTATQIRRERLLLLASARSRRIEDLYKVYNEVIGVLDAEEAGSPLRVLLAVAKLHLQNDNKGAKALLDQVLDSVTEQAEYKLTGLDPGDVAVTAIDSLSNILYKEFCNEKSAVEKYQLSLDVKGLLRRSLASTATVTWSQWIPSQTVLARMLQKLGPATEYERLMNKTFDSIISHLTDSTSLNDMTNIDALARLLTLLPSMEKYSLLVQSCRFYDVDAKEEKEDVQEDDPNGEGEEEDAQNVDQNGEEEEDDRDDATNVVSVDKPVQKPEEAAEGKEIEYDFIDQSDILAWCDGHCFPEATFTGWDASKPIHVCLVCTDSVLCQTCYETRLQWNRDSKPEGEPDFCCTKGLYLSGPVKGWRGVKNGVLHLDPEPVATTNGDGVPPVGNHEESVKLIPFKELLEEIQTAWKAAWEEFWEG